MVGPRCQSGDGVDDLSKEHGMRTVCLRRRRGTFCLSADGL